MQTLNSSPKAILLQTRVMYFALIAGLSFFLLVALYISQEGLTFSFDTKDTFTLVVLGVIAIIPIGYIVSNRIFKSFKPGSTMHDKLVVYKQGFLIRLAFCEGPGLFAIVCLILTSNLYFVIFTVISLASMIINYPSPERIGAAMDLTPPEIASFEN